MRDRRRGFFTDEKTSNAQLVRSYDMNGDPIAGLDPLAIVEPHRTVAQGEDGAGCVEKGGGDLGVEVEVHAAGVSRLRRGLQFFSLP